MVGADEIADFIIDDLHRLFPDGMTVEPISATSEGNRVRWIREYMNTNTSLLMVFDEVEPSSIV